MIDAELKFVLCCTDILYFNQIVYYELDVSIDSFISEFKFAKHFK